ncbi:MAG: cupin domain-containing protein [Betaproteobacteria bacterium]|nr:cupin domain-containing protein [Betaproteobacteria bacterium]
MAKSRTHVQRVYDFASLDHIPDGETSLKVTARRLLSGPNLKSGKSSTVGAVLASSHIACTLGRQARGTGAKAHTHPNEQFNFVLQGTMMNDVEGDRVFASKGMILHTPGMAVHTGLACPDEDLVFLAIKDTRHGITGPPVDGKYDGPNCFAGFGGRINEPRQTTADVLAEAKRLPPGPGKRYVYDMLEKTDSWSGPASAAVKTGTGFALPTGVTGKLLTGEKLHVAVMRFAPGAAIARHMHDNEQFTFVAEGTLEADLESDRMLVNEHCLLHVPSGTAHALTAPRGALVLIAQDKCRSFSA